MPKGKYKEHKKTKSKDSELRMHSQHNAQTNGSLSSNVGLSNADVLSFDSNDAESVLNRDSVSLTSNPMRMAWEKTGGRVIRGHHDAMDKLHKAKDSGKWAKLSQEEKEKWKRKNPIAYARYKHSETAKVKTKSRLEKRLQERQQAAEFLENHQQELGPSSMITSDGKDKKIGRGTVDKMDFLHEKTGINPADFFDMDVLDSSYKENYLTKSFMMNFLKDLSSYPTDTVDSNPELVDYMNDKLAPIDTVFTPFELFDKFQDLGLVGNIGSDVTDTGIDVGTGAMGLMPAVFSTIKSVKDAKKTFVTGNSSGDKFDKALNVASNLSDLTGKVGDVAKSLGAEVGGNLVAGNNIFNGGIGVYKGVKQVCKASDKHDAMEDFQQKHFSDKTREQLEANDLLLRDAATQGNMDASRLKIDGYGKIITGAAKAASGIASFSGAGSSVGAGIKIGNTVVKSGFKAADKMSKARMVKEVVEQTTGLTDDKIREFQKAHGIKSFSRAKQALMKAVGYKSGKRAELYADQTEKRGQYLADLANSDKDDGKAKELVEGLGVEKKDGVYSSEDVMNSLGYWNSRKELAEKYKKTT